MAVRYIEGDLFAGQETVVIHGCNAKGAFGSGFAGKVKSRYPDAAKAYYGSHRENGLVLGSVIWAGCGDRIIGNCITQPTYGRDRKRHISYDALRTCMRTVNLAASEGIPGTTAENGFGAVAMPMIGADLGGGDWKIISRIIEEELRDVEPIVYFLPGRSPPVLQRKS